MAQPNPTRRPRRPMNHQRRVGLPDNIIAESGWTASLTCTLTVNGRRDDRAVMTAARFSADSPEPKRRQVPVLVLGAGFSVGADCAGRGQICRRPVIPSHGRGPGFASFTDFAGMGDIGLGDPLQCGHSCASEGQFYTSLELRD